MTPNVKIKMIGKYGKFSVGQVVTVPSGTLRQMLIEKGLAEFAEPLPKRRQTKREKSGKVKPAAKPVEYKMRFRGGNISTGQFKRADATK